MRDGFKRGTGAFRCESCGRLTRKTRETEGCDWNVCPECFDLASFQNGISDNGPVDAFEYVEGSRDCARRIYAAGGKFKDWNSTFWAEASPAALDEAHADALIEYEQKFPIPEPTADLVLEWAVALVDTSHVDGHAEAIYKAIGEHVGGFVGVWTVWSDLAKICAKVEAESGGPVEDFPEVAAEIVKWYRLYVEREGAAPSDEEERKAVAEIIGLFV
jgi:hypothetical protein